MSVAFGSPLTGKKRLFENGGVAYGSPDDNSHCPPGSWFGSCKRPRFVQSQPGQQLLRHLEGSLLTSSPAGPSRESAFQKLRGMFPDVDPKTVEHVLDIHGDNIEAAIEQLQQLRLSNSNQEGQQQLGHSEQTVANPQAGPQCGSSNRGADRLSTSWLDSFLKQFYESRQPIEARARVAKVLEEFESAVISKQRSESGEMMALKMDFDKLKKDNAILSKAVAVQHSRLQDLNAKEQEIQRMREMLAQYQERLRTLELTNYSLAMHLQRATGPSFGPGSGRPPDVF